jgi:integrase
MARWACEWNSKVWVLPEEKRIKKPKVKRPFVDESTDEEVEQMFSLIKDPAAATFCRVIAATGCRPGEVAHFDWARWELEGRPQHLRGYSPKIEKEFIAICHPLKWIKNIDLTLVKVKDLEPARRPVCEVSRELVTRHYSKMLRMVKKDLKANGWTRLPTWTDLRHMWTIRAEIDGYNSMIAAKAQAHSHRTAQIVYLRHGEEKQILGEIERMANIAAVAVEA